MSVFQTGFARVDITPPLGVYISGYYEPRIADGILDPLLASALAVSDGENMALILSVDVIGFPQSEMDPCRAQIAKALKIPQEAIFIACTHTHLGPVLAGDLFPHDDSYLQVFHRRLQDAAVLAAQDLQETKLEIGRNSCKEISFVRRYRMKNGGIQTNPGLQNPDIVSPVGMPDEQVQLVKLKRCQDEILLVNFQVHPDVIGGTKYSADYPKFVRDTLEHALPNVKCIYFNGAQGDTNHIDVKKDLAHANNGYEHAKHMGRCIAGAVLQCYTKTEPVSCDSVRFGQSELRILSNKPTPDQIPEAERLIMLHDSGRDAEIPYTGMELTTVVAEAHMRKKLEHGPDAFFLHITAVRFGDIAFSGIPGEPFTDIGRWIKEKTPYAMNFVCCCANGYEGYYPVQSAYDEGGYEARSSKFQAGVAEKIADASVQLLNSLQDD